MFNLIRLKISSVQSVNSEQIVPRKQKNNWSVEEFNENRSWTSLRGHFLMYKTLYLYLMESYTAGCTLVYRSARTSTVLHSSGASQRWVLRACMRLSIPIGTLCEMAGKKKVQIFNKVILLHVLVRNCCLRIICAHIPDFENVSETLREIRQIKCNFHKVQ